MSTNFLGEGPAAVFNEPGGLDLDPRSGTLHVAHTINHRLRVANLGTAAAKTLQLDFGSTT